MDTISPATSAQTQPSFLDRMASALTGLSSQYLRLLPLVSILGKHGSTIKRLTGLAPAIDELHYDLKALLNKHQDTITRIDQVLPRLQALLNDLEPAVGHMK